MSIKGDLWEMVEPFVFIFIVMLTIGLGVLGITLLSKLIEWVGAL